MSGVLYLVASAAPPVLTLTHGIDVLKTAGWQPCLILTPTAATWVEVDALGEQCDGLIRIQPRLPQERDPLPSADAILAAPVTFNLLNKWAAGISDTLALGLLNEALGLDLPILAVPVIKGALRRHPAYAPNVEALRESGVDLLEPNVLNHTTGDVLGLEWERVAEALETAVARVR